MRNAVSRVDGIVWMRIRVGRTTALNALPQESTSSIKKQHLPARELYCQHFTTPLTHQRVDCLVREIGSQVVCYRHRQCIQRQGIALETSTPPAAATIQTGVVFRKIQQLTAFESHLIASSPHIPGCFGCQRAMVDGNVIQHCGRQQVRRYRLLICCQCNGIDGCTLIGSLLFLAGHKGGLQA